jgi:ABC-type sugar transport system ATPase subunit
MARQKQTISKEKLLLEIRDVSKTFPGVKALDKVNLHLNRGEVLGLVGENGAGKSTLMKICAGVYEADPGEGEIILNGKQVHYHSAYDAKQDGIVMIFQELSLVLDLSIGENIFLGSLPRKQKGIIDWDKLYIKSKEVLNSIECREDPRDIIRVLPIAQQQLVEIGRALALGAKVVIFDEPTSSLTEKEITLLFKNIKRLKSQGVGIIYISHKLDEIFSITDRITVFRDGKNSAEFITKETSIPRVVEKMIGRSLSNYYHKSKAIPGKELLRVENLSLKDRFSNIRFAVHHGEVVGLYGLVGAGRTEIAETIFGIRKKTSGTIFLDDKPIEISSSEDAVRMGLGLVPEDRKMQGLILGMSVRNNMCLAKLPWLINRFGVVDSKAPMEIYIEYKKKLAISSPSPLQQVVYLSGGNQQKVVISKWLCMSPRLLILDEPTRGIDVGSKAEIHKLIAELAESGIGILVISSEMPEIMGICNRIYTISQGRITAELKNKEISEKNLLHAITPRQQIAEFERVLSQ